MKSVVFITVLLILSISTNGAEWNFPENHTASVEWTKDWEVTWVFNSKYIDWSVGVENETHYGWALKFYAPVQIVMRTDGYEYFSPTLKQGWSRLWPHPSPVIPAHDVWGKSASFSIAQCALPYKDSRVWSQFTAQDWSEKQPWVYKKALGSSPYLYHLHKVSHDGVKTSRWESAPNIPEESEIFQIVWNSAVGAIITGGMGGEISLGGALSGLVKSMIAKLLPTDCPTTLIINRKWEKMSVVSTYVLQDIISYQGELYPGLEPIDGGYLRPKKKLYQPEHRFVRALVELTLPKQNPRRVVFGERLEYCSDGLGKICLYPELDNTSPTIISKPNFQMYKAIALRNLDDEKRIYWKKSPLANVSTAFPIYTVGRVVGGAP